MPYLLLASLHTFTEAIDEVAKKAGASETELLLGLLTTFAIKRPLA